MFCRWSTVVVVDVLVTLLCLVVLSLLSDGCSC